MLARPSSIIPFPARTLSSVLPEADAIFWDIIAVSCLHAMLLEIYYVERHFILFSFVGFNKLCEGLLANKALSWWVNWQGVVQSLLLSFSIYI